MLYVWLLLIALVVAGAAVANKTPVPNAVIWCILGLVAAFIPGFPSVRFQSRCGAISFPAASGLLIRCELPWPEFRDHLRSIAILAIALVVVTTANQRGPLLADIHSRRNSGKNS
jgi:NhaP-type Na+/H+ or K+/H+ antiporter